MRQIWIDNQRIDSIRHLRRVFQDTQQPELAARSLLEQSAAGALFEWLSRQPELALLTIQAAKYENVHTQELKALNQELAQNKLPDPAHLAALCGVSPELFAAVEYGATEKQREDKSALLKTQPWWDAHKNSLAPVSDWDFIVLNNDQLNDALSKHRKLLQTHSDLITTIFLCSMDEVYFLDLRSINRQVHYVGCGAPLTRINPIVHPGIEILQQHDYLIQQEMALTGLRLHCTNDLWKFLQSDPNAQNVHGLTRA